MKWIKDNYDMPIILGSQHIDRAYPHCDYIIAGYAENAINALIAYLFGNGAPKPKMRTFRDVTFIDSNADYVAHPWDDCSVLYEDRDFMHHNEFGTTEFSRGCRFKCKFCTTTILGVKGKTTRELYGIEHEIRHNYDKFGMKYYWLTDPTFNNEKGKINLYGDIVESLPFEPYFIGFIRPDLLIRSEDEWEGLLRMRLLCHFYGIETFNSETAKFIGKGNPEMIKEGIVRVKDYFESKTDQYRAHLNMIAGLPYESKQSVLNTIDWIKKHWANTQPASMGPLEIQDESHPFRSNIALTYENLGYKVINKTIDDMQTDELKNAWNGLQAQETDEGIQRLGHNIFWENEYMDIYEAQVIADKVDEHWKTKSGYNLKKLTAEELHWTFCDENGEPLSLEQRLSMRMGMMQPFIDNFEIFVNKYKQKKLNYR